MNKNAANPEAPAAVSCLALGVVALAGYADAVSYLRFGKVYVSFMSGNTTALGAALGQGRWPQLALLAGVVAAFVVGVLLGTGLHRVGRRPAALVLAVVAALLALASWAGPAGLWVLVLGMGLLNAAVHQAGRNPISLTFVTGTLVRIGVALADGLGGRGWPPGWYWQALDWLSLATGAAIGAGLYGALGARALLPAAGGALLLAWRAGQLARA